MWTNCTFYRYTNKAVCVLSCRLLCAEQPSTHPYREPNKNNPTCSQISFKHRLLYHSLRYARWFNLFRFPKETLYSLLQYWMHATWHVLYFPFCDYFNNTWRTVTDMKLTTEFSTSIYSYLPSTKYTPRNPPVKNPKSVFCAWSKKPIYKPTQNDKCKASLCTSSCDILNWMAASIAWTYRALFSKNMALLKFHQILTYLKPDLQQSDSGTSQATCHKIKLLQTLP